MNDKTLLCGAACVDITPPAGLSMAGFAARIDPAQAAHDALTARAIVVNDTAVVALDVLGITRDMSESIAAKAGFDPSKVIVHATHTHGGPATMPNRLFSTPDADYLRALESGAVEALRQANASKRPATLSFGVTQNPSIGKNRRHPNGITDPNLSLLRFSDLEGNSIALLANYACHPVTLGADNHMWTADYPHFLRQALETEAITLFTTGFVGDVNTGHSAAASNTREPQLDRTFARAEAIGQALAADLRRIALTPAPSAAVYAAQSFIDCAFAPSPSEENLSKLVQEWQQELPQASAVRAHLLRIWLDWAAQSIERRGTISLPVTVLNWGGIILAGLPGEIFTRTALKLRAALSPNAVIPIGFATDNPGYIPPAEEYPFGGYEVEEAHRFYNMPARFVEGTAEALCDEAIRLAQMCQPNKI